VAVAVQIAETNNTRRSPRPPSSQCRLLVVGAGGIGCELLKTLVLSGFKDINVADMDTIETSNLNRQFLFRKKHVGSAKCEVAAEAVRQFCPTDPPVIKSHRVNVIESFNPDFVSGFDLVMNGLDNLKARMHMNRLCLAAGKPLIESGTAGFKGQTSVHIKDEVPSNRQTVTTPPTPPQKIAP